MVKLCRRFDSKFHPQESTKLLDLFQMKLKQIKSIDLPGENPPVSQSEPRIPANQETLDVEDAKRRVEEDTRIPYFKPRFLLSLTSPEPIVLLIPHQLPGAGDARCRGGRIQYG